MSQPFLTGRDDGPTEVEDGAPHACLDEMITPGGELAFVTAMVQDSLVVKHQVRTRGAGSPTATVCGDDTQCLSTQVRWYTSMVGKKVTLKRVLAVLRDARVVNVRTTEFLQVSPHSLTHSETGDMPP